MDIDFLSSEFLNSEVDIVISRVDTRIEDRLFDLYKAIPNSFLADTLVYYACQDFEKADNNLPAGITIEKARPERKEELTSLISSIFSGYKNHYHSNPIFQSVDLAKGYLEWNLPFLEDKDKICLILFDHGIPCAFLTAKIYQEDGFADIILNGALKAYEGQGKYSFLLRQLKQILLEMNIQKLIVSTQLSNQRVQKVWTKEQFYLDKSYYTFHHFISEKALKALQSTY